MVQTMPERRVLPARLRMSSPPRKSTLVAASRASFWPDGTSLSGRMDWNSGIYSMVVRWVGNVGIGIK